MLSPVPHATARRSTCRPPRWRRRRAGTTVDQSRSLSMIGEDVPAILACRSATSIPCPMRRHDRSPVRPSAGSVIQSCGSTTWASLAQLSGSVRCNQLSLADGERCYRHAADRSGPVGGAPGQLLEQPSCVRRGLGVVPQLGRADHLPIGVEHDHAVLLAGDADAPRPRGEPARRPRRLERRPTTSADPARTEAGSSSGCGAEPRATTSPVSRSRTSTFVLCVDESTPATRRAVTANPYERARAARQTCTNRSGPAMIALMQSTLPYLDAEELFRLVPLPDALDALRACFAGAPSHVDRVHTSAGGGEFLVMPAAAGDAAGVKLVGIQPANPRAGCRSFRACTCCSTCASASPWRCSTVPR